MFSSTNNKKSLWVGCLVASVLVCLLATPTGLEAQTTPSQSTSSGSSSETEEEGGTTSPPPVDEWDEEEMSITHVPGLSTTAAPSEVEPDEPSLVAAFFAELWARARGWMQ